MSIATVETYAHALRLLICFAAEKLETSPSKLMIEQLDAPLVLNFLCDLETRRKSSARTRNARLAAVNTFFRYIEYQLPACIEQAQRVHAIPIARTMEPLVHHLSRVEIQALLDAPDPRTPAGTRDRAMLHLAFAAGLRVSELVGLLIDDLRFTPAPELHVMGKGRRQRALPLWKETVVALRAWLAVRNGSKDPALFLNAAGRAMTRAGFEYVLDKHVKTAVKSCPSIADKRVTPHVLRHSCAMHMLLSTRDIRRVSLWLGHACLQSTEMYLRADPNEKLEALNAAVAPMIRPGRFRAPDSLIAMLRDTGRQSR